jgi:TonB family protein
LAPSKRISRLLLMGAILSCASVAFAAEVHRAIVSRVAPTYPELARRMHVAGKVVLLVTVKPDGTVSGTKAESGHALLIPAAEEAVRQWRFATGPESTESTIDVNFTDTSH